MRQLNHMICPNCGHDFYTQAAYATCDACQTFFYAAQSQTCNPPPHVPNRAMNSGALAAGYPSITVGGWPAAPQKEQP